MRPISPNPLLRWGSGLGWSARGLGSMAAGAEGCRHAFNATNAVRVSHYFCARQPPTFLDATGPGDIASLHSLGASSGSVAEESMLFGKDIPFISPLANPPPRTVAMENYSPRCVSVHRTRMATPDLPFTNLIVGDENKGMSAERHDAADAVVFVPQYGTISSLNVVTTLGLGMFYCWIDTNVADHRVLIDSTRRTSLPEDLERYFGAFSSSLPFKESDVPTGEVGSYNNIRPNSTRVDERPIHPGYYAQSASAICDTYTELMGSMAAWVSEQRGAAISAEGFVSMLPSVLFENAFDQRNFGGLIRNANAMLCRNVFYIGKRRFNVKGAVGCNHYSKPTYLGPLDDDSTFTEVERRLAGKKMWLLSCGHEPQYQTYDDVLPTISGNGWGADVANAYMGCSSSSESLRELRLLADRSPSISLSDKESDLVRVVGKGPVVLVPQEGKAPHPRLLALCTGILHVLPPAQRTLPMHGLPSQVASGIALHRLLTTSVPELKV